MRIGDCRRYNPDKKGSFEIAVWMTDWELAYLIKALKIYREHHKEKGNKNIVTWCNNRIKILGKALGKVLRYEITDLKGLKRLDLFPLEKV